MNEWKSRYSEPENVGGDLESERRCRDLVVNLVRNLES